MTEDNFQVPNLVRGIQVMEFLASQSSPRTITEIANALDFPKNSVMRIVNALAHHGYVHRDSQTKACHLTRKLFSMASRMPQERTLVESSMGAMRSVRDRYKETVVLTILDGQRGIILEQVQGLHAFRFVCEPGVEQQLHSSASTKAILALMSKSERDILLDGYQFSRFTKTTITSRTTFEQELTAILAQGFAEDRGEQVEGVHCMAAAIQDHSGRPVAAITLTGPASRIFAEYRAEEIGAYLKEQTREVSTALGYDSSTNTVPLSA